MLPRWSGFLGIKDLVTRKGCLRADVDRSSLYSEPRGVADKAPGLAQILCLSKTLALDP